MTKYQYEVQLSKSMPRLKGKELDEAKEQVISFLNKKVTNLEPFRNLMLLCRERNYYTILNKKTLTDVNEIAEKIMTFLTTDTFLLEEGGLKYIENKYDYLEIWIGSDYYALFDADFIFVDLERE